MNLNSNIRRNLPSNRSTDQDGRSQKSQCLSACAFIPGSTWEFSTECLSNVLSSDGSPGIRQMHITHKPLCSRHLLPIRNSHSHHGDMVRASICLVAIQDSTKHPAPVFPSTLSSTAHVVLILQHEKQS